MQAPRVIKILVMVDLALAAAYLLDRAAGQPWWFLTAFIDLNGEQNLPTWYSSVQWCFVGVLLGLFAWSKLSLVQPRSWLLMALPVIFVGFSLDEATQIHEWLGGKSDALLPDGSRVNTPFLRTGIWMFLLGIPFLALFSALILSVRVYFLRAPGALARLLLGMAIMLAGSIGIETLYNFVVPSSIYGLLQVFFEELFEMLGATLILWGSWELLIGHGLVWKLDREDPVASLEAVPAGVHQAGKVRLRMSQGLQLWFRRSGR